MTPLEVALILYIALFVSVVNSEPKPLVLEDLVTNAENLLKSYGVKENTLTDARIYFEENVGSSDDISQTAKTVKDSFEKARDMFSVNFENVRTLDDAKTDVEVQVVKAIESLDQSNHLNSYIYIQLPLFQESLTQVIGQTKDERTSQLTRIIEATGLDKLGLSGATPNHSNIGGIASDLSTVLGLGQLFLAPPLAATERDLNFGLLDGVSLGRSLTAVSPYASLLFSIVAPYLTACASLVLTLIRVISLTIGFQ